MRDFSAFARFAAATACAALFAVRLAQALLVFPQASVLQITSSISVPVAALPLYFDWGFQMNYDFPVLAASLYSSPIWRRQRRRSTSDQAWPAERQWKGLAYNNSNDQRGPTQRAGCRRHANDFSAGELYAAIEEVLESNGWSRSCLPHSICQLAQRPFGRRQEEALADAQDTRGATSARMAQRPEGVLEDILSFLLSPQRHDGFAAHESLARDTFTLAEQRGRFGGPAECQRWYGACQMDLLAVISRVAAP